MALTLGPFRTRPIFKSKVWAGARLGELLEAPANTGEAWLVCDLPDASCEVLDGPYAGRPLADVVRERPDELLGEDAPGGRFPLLVKFLDIGAPLSVQVHPDAEAARELGDGEVGKCEAWLVVAVEEDGRVLYGLEPGTESDEVPALSESGRLPKHMPTFHPEPGEGLEIVPGTLHTAHGVLVLEVQEPSDITYRVYDYGRERGPLHLDQAERCLQRATGPPERADPPGWTPGQRELSPRSPFSFLRLDLAEGETFVHEPGRPGVIVVLEGRLDVAGLAVEKGQAIVIPASAGRVEAHAPLHVRAGYARTRPYTRS